MTDKEVKIDVTNISRDLSNLELILKNSAIIYLTQFL